MTTPTTELLELLEALCEERLSADDSARLERLVIESPAAKAFYCEYVLLHGNLLWDTAVADQLDSDPSIPVAASIPPIANVDTAPPRSRWTMMVTAVVTCVLIGTVVFWPREQSSDDSKARSGGMAESDQTDETNPDDPIRRPRVKIAVGSNDGPGPLDDAPDPNRSRGLAGNPDAVAPEGTTGLSNYAVVAFVDRSIRQSWEEADVTPSPRADDAEWIRRVYLDIVGHIPPVEMTRDFLASDDPDKRRKAIDELLDSPQYYRNWSAIWANLLIGRADSPGVDRTALVRFLRRAFAENRPWDEVVVDLVSAEGRADENGAANFLLAHLNNQAVPATAVTARVLMGLRIQCTQCHRHPTHRWSQDSFWQLNSFFHQTTLVRKRNYDQERGTMVTTTRLVSRPLGGPTFYETTNGEKRVAYPTFNGTAIDVGPDVNRRVELARLMTDGPSPAVATAFVNRMWQHFLGTAFTMAVDDLGPHSPQSHPEVLGHLTTRFVAGGFDVKRLIRWICLSAPYQLSSQIVAEDDRPEHGMLPLFTRTYAKRMTAEQLYDSLLLATGMGEWGESGWRDAEAARDRWMQQFVVAFGTDENDEQSLLDGTVPQALLMMNGELVNRATSGEAGTVLGRVVASRVGDTQKLRELALCALSREPNSQELSQWRNFLRMRTRGLKGRRAQLARAEALQDLFWAFLNSAEFAMVH